MFVGRGRFEPYHITIDVVKPVMQSYTRAARRVPRGLHDGLKENLVQMERDGIVGKVDNPTDWVNSLVIVENKDGSLRLCLDPKDLNKAI